MAENDKKRSGVRNERDLLSIWEMVQDFANAAKIKITEVILCAAQTNDLDNKTLNQETAIIQIIKL